MNQYDVNRMSQRLMASQEKFVSMIRLQFEHIDSMTQYMSGFRDYMGGFRETFVSMQQVFGGIQEEMRSSLEVVRELNQNLEAMQKAVTDNYVATNENNARIEKLLTKVEAYFGTAGLDYDN